MFTFEIQIIGSRGHLRNPKLIDLQKTWTVSFSSPVVLSSEDLDQFEKAQLANSTLIGRRLVRGEIGCALAHETARKASTSDWTLVLEDDADIDRAQIESALQLISALPPGIPIIVNLLSGRCEKDCAPRLESSWLPASGAVAYLASAGVRGLDHRPHDPIGVADWPLHLAKVLHFKIHGLGVKELDGVLSLIETTGVRPKTNWRLHVFTSTRIPKIMLSFGWSGLKFAFFVPLIRDAMNRIKPKSPTCHAKGIRYTRSLP